jgi:puromycin-sensitive aminopeptidase
MARQYPPGAYRRMYEGVTGLVSPAWEAEVRAFFPERKIELGGKTLEQYLEQLRVAVRFQAREGLALVSYLGPTGR